jgi:crotonobetainyl-CoA:carnitine CoA-transferase CaiB-like acyl-CoA transferase
MSQTLEDIKIADFTWVVAGPLCVRYLADYGAQVIHVETGTRIDPIRYTPPYKDDIPGTNRSGYFHNYNSNKYGITLNLRHPKALELAKKLILWADIVAENFNPGVMKRLGLGYEEINEMKPDIIMISLGSKGQTGPQARLPAFGAHLAALSGFTHITGWPDRDPPVIFGAYTDSIAGRFGAATLLAALDYRRRTGKGQYIDLSQSEAGIEFLAPPLLDYDVNRRILERKGNRHPSAAPHGAYRCKGEDRWCAIAVFADQEWKAMRQVMGSPPWAEDDKFATLLGRKSNEEELDNLIEQWTINYSAEEVMNRLQQAGVSAGVVETAEDLHSDPQLEHRHHFWVLEHQEIGESTYDSMGSQLSKTPAELYKAAHTLGEDNHYVYTQILGLSDGEFVELLEEGVFD